MTKVYSFDVFDTLITRKVGLPEHVFLLTGRRISEELKLEIDASYFANARILAERQLIQMGVHNAAIDNIYDQLARNIDISQQLAYKIAQIELETERENLLPIPKNIKLLEGLRDEGAMILYVSDMYLSGEIIKQILSDHGIYAQGEKIYVSCDYGASKVNGKLFEIILKDLAIKADDLHHYGNSLKGEIKGAQKIGASCTFLPEGNLNRYEKFLAQAEFRFRVGENELLDYSKMAAASRYSRLQGNGRKKQIYDVAASVASPILYKFVANVLRNAHGKTVYFLARDGYIMRKIAERINKNGHYNCDIKYLYISREILILSRIGNLTDADYIKNLLAIYAMETLRNTLRKLSIKESIINEIGLNKHQLDKTIIDFEKDELERIFLNKKIHSDILKESENKRRRLLAYLKTEEFLDRKGTVIVDVGWALTIQNYLVEILKELEVEFPEGFYIGINETADSSIKRGKKNGYFWDHRKNKFHINAPRIIQVFEVICSAPHGQTVDYNVKSNLVKPVLNDYETKHLNDWGLKDLEDGILNSLEYYLQFQENIEAHNTDQDLLKELLKMFWLNPTKAEVDAWGEYPYDISENGQEIIKLYERKPVFKILNHILKTGKLPNSKKDHWPQAHIHGLNPLTKKFIILSLNAKKNIHSLKSKFI